jgi:AraC-like DNA-binding protein
MTVNPTAEWVPDSEGWTVIRLAAGAGHCLRQEANHELNAGDCLILGHNFGTRLRASLLNPMKLQFYTVCPQYLGLLTVFEWRQFTFMVEGSKSYFMLFQHNEPLAEKLSQIVAQRDVTGLPTRCSLLEFWAEVVTAILPRIRGESHELEGKLRQRFRELFSQLSEGELFARSLPELAEQLNCSTRHLYRIFSEEFGVPFRVHKTEMRLLRARQLLAETNATAATVAARCGYRQMSLFGSLFKQRFGMTPIEWRRQARSNQ